MTFDPFRTLATLEADAVPDPSSVAAAVTAARAAGVPMAVATRAMQILLKPERRAAHAFLSVTQSPTWKRLHSQAEDPYAADRPLTRRITRALLDDLNAWLSEPSVLPEVSVERDIGHYGTIPPDDGD